MTEFYTKLVSLYTSSFFDIIKSNNKLEEIIIEVKKLQLCICKDPSAVKLITAPIYTDSQKTDMISKLCASLSLSKEFFNFLKTLSSNNRLKDLSNILKYFEYLYNISKDQVPVEITIAEDLSEDRKTTIVKQVENYFNTKVIPTFKIDHKILAGLIVRKGNLMYDASLFGMFSCFKEETKNKILQLELNK